MAAKKITKKLIKEALKKRHVEGYSRAKISLLILRVFVGDYYGKIDEHNVLTLERFIGRSENSPKSYRIQL